MRGIRGSSLVLPSAQGYSARRERLRHEAEQAEVSQRQSIQRLNQVAASSADLRTSSMHQQRRQHYHSMSTIQVRLLCNFFMKAASIRP